MKAPPKNAILRHLKRHYLVWAVVVFVLILVGLYSAGYRPGPGLTIVKVGTLVVTDIPATTNVYTDLADRGSSDGGPMSVRLTPGNHRVIVDAPLAEPWVKIVTIKSNETTTVSPILALRNPKPEKLDGAGATAAANTIRGTKLPTEAAPLRLGCANIYVSANRIIASAATSSPECPTPPEYLCTEGACSPTVVYSPGGIIHSVIPFANRDDALIVATGEWVYTIAIDPRTPQFFAPLIHGILPTVGVASSTAFYLSDQGTNYVVPL